MVRALLLHSRTRKLCRCFGRVNVYIRRNPSSLRRVSCRVSCRPETACEGGHKPACYHAGFLLLHGGDGVEQVGCKCRGQGLYRLGIAIQTSSVGFFG